MKRILGLDLGTNSIGWALVEIDHENKTVTILGLGSRILPMDAGEIKEFEESGKIKSTAAQRTEKRGPRRLNERFLLRRDRLHLVLDLLDSLPKHYKINIEFDKKGKRSGKFKNNTEPKIAYKKKDDSKKHDFLFKNSYDKMLEDLSKGNPKIRNEKGYRIPYDWTLYYLRQKALTKKIELDEFAWILLSYNQKRGYEKVESLDLATKPNEIIESYDFEVTKVKECISEGGKKYYQITLKNGFEYKEFTDLELTEIGDIKELKIKSFTNDAGDTIGSKTEYTVTDIYELTIDHVEYEKPGKESKKHKYLFKFKNGWEDLKEKTKYTNEFKELNNRKFDYIVRVTYNNIGEIKPERGRDRKLDVPSFADDSNDWTLIKKKTEKKIIAYNAEQNLEDSKGNVSKNVSPYIYDIIKKDVKNEAKTKIIGGLVQVVDREYYRNELTQIIDTQRRYHNNLDDKSVFKKCIERLYPNNKSHADSLLKNKKALTHLLVNDIIFYQRPLKSKKSEVANCRFEIKHWRENIDKETGEISNIPVFQKVIHASNPLFQEFRIWNFLHNIKLIELEKVVATKTHYNVDVTKEYFKTPEDYDKLFNYLNNRKSLNQSQFLTYCKKEYGINSKNFVWNYSDEANDGITGNETRTAFATRFKKIKWNDWNVFLTQEKEMQLWHYLYSVNYKVRTKRVDEVDYKSVNTFVNNTFLKGYILDDDIKEKLIFEIANFPKFQSKYGSYSEKAIKKLLPLIRKGVKSFNGKFEIVESLEKELKTIDYKSSNITKYLKITKEELKSFSKDKKRELEIRKNLLHKALVKHKINKRVETIIEKLKVFDNDKEALQNKKTLNKVVETDATKMMFPKGLFSAFWGYNEIENFRELNLTQASYLIYGRHSEIRTAIQWKTPNAVRDGVRTELKQHSLNNPVAEKVIRETMQLVADLWESELYGNSQENYFTNINVEIARELKKSVKDKKREHENQLTNKKTNDRIRFLLGELKGANPFNKNHFEKLKIIEEGSFIKFTKQGKNFKTIKRNGNEVTREDVKKLYNKVQFKKSELDKYRLWLEQGYKSPYTGEIISLTDLFDETKYEIEHIFPRQLITLNAPSNKVVCESRVNKLKSNMTGLDFIQKKAGTKIETSLAGEKKKVVTILSEDVYKSVVSQFHNKRKKFILLSKEIPEGMTNSQMNNAKYIAKKAMELLSHIVRDDNEYEFRSKNVLPVTGMITSILKQAWKFNDVWNELLTPRFKRLNELSKSNLFGDYQIDKQGNKYFDCDPHKLIKDKYDKKRLDHRHHALDALVIALTTEEHVNFINNINSNKIPNKKEDEYKFKNYRTKLKQKIMFSKPNAENPKNKDWFYMKPGNTRKVGVDNSRLETVAEHQYIYKKKNASENLKQVVLDALKDTLVSFKKNEKVLKKATNSYQSYYNEKGELRINSQGIPKKGWNKQLGGSFDNSANMRNISIRKSMHDEMPYGKRKYNFEVLNISDNLSRKDDIIIDEIKTRVIEAIILNDNDEKKTKSALKKTPIKDLNNLDCIETYFKVKEKVERNKIRKELGKIENWKQLRKIGDVKIQEELIMHLNLFENDFKQAFSPNGLLIFNKNRKIPIFKVTLTESGSKKKTLGNNIGNKHKMVKGANFCFNIKINKENERIYTTISLRDFLKSYKEKKSVKKDDKWNDFLLFPNDLVFFPTEEQFKKSFDFNLNDVDYERIYKLVNTTGVTANFMKVSFSNVIFDYNKKGKEDKKWMKELLELEISDFKIPSSQTKGKLVYLENEIGLTSRQNKNPNDLVNNQSIKERCWKLKVDRLGNITDIIK